MTDICTKAAKIVNEKGKDGLLEFVRNNCTLAEVDALHETLGIEFELAGGYITDIWGGFFSPNHTEEHRLYIAQGCDEQLMRSGW